MAHPHRAGEVLIAGLDEAGRGPVFGEMVLCGVLFEENAIEGLRAAGIRDSKMLSPRRREALAELVLKRAIKCEVIELTPREIDESREEINLNELEAAKFAQIIGRLNPRVAYVDSADTIPSKFRERILRYARDAPELVVENFADRKYVVVAAASIVAKARRDKRVSELRRKYGDFGSGYSSDPRTVEFLRRWVREKGELPPFTRKSWKTARRVLRELGALTEERKVVG